MVHEITCAKQLRGQAGSLTHTGTGLIKRRLVLQEMTYVKQLEDYEEAVMQKRLDEMPQAERERILGEIEQQKQGNGQQGEK